MAVYTVLETEQIATLIEPYGLGPLLDYEGAADGIENTTYFLRTDRRNERTEVSTAAEGHYVLTIFEELQSEELSFFVQLTQLLAKHSLPVPSPLRDYNGGTIQLIAHKPALVFDRALGSHVKTPSSDICGQLGEVLAKMHLIGSTSKLSKLPGNRSIEWLVRSSSKVLAQLNDEDKALLREQINGFEATLAKQPDLPKSFIHNDLFRDNCLINDNQISAIIDFYNAGYGPMILDVGICVNDWCANEAGQLDLDKLKALVNAYHNIRPLSADEITLFPQILQICATRFWVSRTLSRVNSQRGSKQLAPSKPPEQYRQYLLDRIKNARQYGLKSIIA